MKASLSWLREFLPGLPSSAADIAARLTAVGLEVEGIEEYGAACDSCLVVRVVSMRPHPEKSGLRLVTVDRGASPPLEVVCGAPNVPDPGGLVVLAPLGTTLPDGTVIAPRAIGGVTSEGMLVSEAELGLLDNASGLLVLPAGQAAPGTPLSHALPCVRDTLFEIGLTPNRPDCLGHLGLARELAAIFQLPFETRAPRVDVSSDPAALHPHVDVAIHSSSRCPRYGAAVLAGVTVGPSPHWVRYRLASLGVRPISNVVDATNLVCLELGQPTHAFDWDKVAEHRIIVRQAKESEPIVTLDGVARQLDPDDLVIADERGPVAIAGVMGGGDSEIGEGSSNVLVEVAYFDPRGVRRSARRHGLHTEASHRFERGIDHGITKLALARLCELVEDLAGGKLRGAPHVVEAEALPTKRAMFRPARAAAVLGRGVARDEARSILARLGFRLESGFEDGDTFVIPSHRPDVSREIDLIEEVGRLLGFDTIVPRLPAIVPTREGDTRERLDQRARQAAVELGLSEALCYGFVSEGALARIGAPTPTVILANPLGDRTAMRTSLLPGLLDVVQAARRYGERDVRMFSLGARFLELNKDGLPRERPSFAAILAGDRANYLSPASPSDVWDAKGIALEMVERLTRRTPTVELASGPACPVHLHPRGAARLRLDGEEIGVLGPLHPDVTDALELAKETFVVELWLDTIHGLTASTPRYEPIGRFPASIRDLAVVVDNAVPAGDVLAVARDASAPLSESVTLFDRFVGGSVPEGHASLALRFVYRASDRTLTDAEVDEKHAAVRESVQDRFAASVRA